MKSSTRNAATYDAIVIGAGLNGLTAATTLAQAGRKVIVLETRSVPGGLASGCEFHPGYRSAGLLHDTTGLLPEVVKALHLSNHGLRRTERPPEILSVGHEDGGLLLHHDPGQASHELDGAGTSDAESYASFRAFVNRIKPVARRLLTNPPLDWMEQGWADWRALLGGGFAMRRLGKRDMMELLRLGPMCVSDWLDEQFDAPALKSTLALPALRGCWGGPKSPGTNGVFLRYEALAGGQVIGGPAALVAAVVAAAKAAGVEIRTSTPVGKINVAAGIVRGVSCDDGESIQANRVLSSCDPKQTFLLLVGEDALAPSFAASIRATRMRGLTANVNLALNKPLRFRCRLDLEVEFSRTAQNLPDLERSFDAAKYQGFVEHPPLDIYVPSVAQDNAAPPGHSTVCILVQSIPYDLDGGWNDDSRGRLGDSVVSSLSPHVDDLDASLVGREVLTPPDIESRYSVAGGHIYHGEHGLDQLLVRPVRQCARYSTPVEGLYLCGSGCHPGGGITCAPGFLAANTIIRSAHQRK